MVAQSLCPETAVTHHLLCIVLPESAHNGLALHFEVCQQMTLGPTATHQVGLAHRNMTPSNILLENVSQRVHNTDVGLTRAVDDVAIANPGVITATPLDMPSDEAPGEAIDHHSDLYSLGHSLCTRKLVFSAKTHLKPTLFALLLLVSVIGTTEAAGITRVTEYLGIILQLETQNGTLWVEIEDPNVTVSVDDGAVVVEGVGAKKLRLKPGKHKWMTTRNGEFASTHWVTIERGGKKILRVKQLPPAPKTASTTIPDEEEIPGDSSKPATPKPESTERVKVGPIGEPEMITRGKLGEELTRLNSYDGVVFELPQNLRRFYSGQHVDGPNGEHVFDEVPEQLWGQRCTSRYRDGGQMKFSVHSTRRSGRQRLWLLVCVSDWEKGGRYESPASLRDKGWAAWRSLTSSPITDRKRTKKSEWFVFYRDAEPGETHAIVTHPRRTPLLVWGSIDLDGILCEAHWDQRVGTFGPGASIPLGNESSRFRRSDSRGTDRSPLCQTKRIPGHFTIPGPVGSECHHWSLRLESHG